MRPIAVTGWWMVVSVGQMVVATGVSSKPVTERSPGTRRPMPCATATTAAAMSSLLERMAVGRFFSLSSALAAARPER